MGEGERSIDSSIRTKLVWLFPIHLKHTPHQWLQTLVRLTIFRSNNVGRSGGQKVHPWLEFHLVYRRLAEINSVYSQLSHLLTAATAERQLQRGHPVLEGRPPGTPHPARPVIAQLITDLGKEPITAALYHVSNDS